MTRYPTPHCPRHPGEELIPIYSGGCIEGYGCVKCAQEQPIRFPMRYEVKEPSR